MYRGMLSKDMELHKGRDDNKSADGVEEQWDGDSVMWYDTIVASGVATADDVSCFIW
jgi:hypothetical protein